jgi:DNA polymerase III delta subunit
MFARRKLIVMKYASDLPTKDIPFLLEYLKHPSPKTLLVITAREWNKKGEMGDQFQKCFRRIPAASIAGTKGTALWITFPAKRKKETEVAAWIQQQCSGKGLRMENDALELFYEICGKDKLTMQSEIEKLVSFKHDKRKITIEDIKEIAAENKVFDVYALLELICHQEHARAIEVLRSLLDSRKNHSFIIWHLDNFFSKLAIAKMELQSGASDEAAAEKAGIRFYKDQFIQNAKIVRSDIIMKAPGQIFLADRLMKSGFPEEIVLGKLIFDLT